MSAVLEPEVVESIPAKAVRRYYSEEERARTLALYDLCGNLTETASKSGIPDSTISAWIHGHRRGKDNKVPKLRNDMGLSLANDFEEIALEVASVALRKLRSKGADKIPFGQLMQGGSHAVNNSQLLRGLPTAISASAISPEERQSKVAELLARIEARAVDAVPADEKPKEIEG